MIKTLLVSTGIFSVQANSALRNRNTSKSGGLFDCDGLPVEQEACSSYLACDQHRIQPTLSRSKTDKDGKTKIYDACPYGTYGPYWFVTGGDQDEVAVYGNTKEQHEHFEKFKNDKCNGDSFSMTSAYVKSDFPANKPGIWETYGCCPDLKGKALGDPHTKDPKADCKFNSALTMFAGVGAAGCCLFGAIKCQSQRSTSASNDGYAEVQSSFKTYKSIPSPT